MNPNDSIISHIQNLDVSNIEGIRFSQNDGESYSISLDSIIRIALYIGEKYRKSKFVPGELGDERNYFVENFQSTLSPEDYKLVVDILTKWVNIGGGFEIIYKNTIQNQQKPPIETPSPFASVYNFVLRIVAGLNLVGVIVAGVVFPVLGAFHCQIRERLAGCYPPYGWMSALWESTYNDFFLLSLYLMGIPILALVAIDIFAVIILLTIILTGAKSHLGRIIKTLVLIPVCIINVNIFTGVVQNIQSPENSTLTLSREAPGFTLIPNEQNLKDQQNYQDALLKQALTEVKNQSFTEQDLRQIEARFLSGGNLTVPSLSGDVLCMAPSAASWMCHSIEKEIDEYEFCKIKPIVYADTSKVKYIPFSVDFFGAIKENPTFGGAYGVYKEQKELLLRTLTEECSHLNP